MTPTMTMGAESLSVSLWSIKGASGFTDRSRTAGSSMATTATTAPIRVFIGFYCTANRNSVFSWLDPASTRRVPVLPSTRTTPNALGGRWCDFPVRGDGSASTVISGCPVWFMLKRMAADRKIIAEHRWITRCLNVVLRFRWFDREPSSQSISADWRFAALIIATLFLNLHFWQTHGDDVWMSCSILPYAFIVAAVAIAITTLFFLGPAAITQSMNRSLLCAVERSE